MFHEYRKCIAAHSGQGVAPADLLSQQPGERY